MSNPAAVAMPVEDAGDGRWMSMVSTCLVINFTTTVLLVNHFDGQTCCNLPPLPPGTSSDSAKKHAHPTCMISMALKEH